MFATYPDSGVKSYLSQIKLVKVNQSRATLLVELCGMRASFPSRGHREACGTGADSDVISRLIKAFASRKHDIARRLLAAHSALSLPQEWVHFFGPVNGHISPGLQGNFAASIQGAARDGNIVASHGGYVVFGLNARLRQHLDVGCIARISGGQGLGGYVVAGLHGNVGANARIFSAPMCRGATP